MKSQLSSAPNLDSGLPFQLKSYLISDQKVVDSDKKLAISPSSFIEFSMPSSRIRVNSSLLRPVDEGLPFTSSAGVTSELGVGQETNLAMKGRLDFALVAACSRKEGSTKLGLDKELCVEFTGCRVEGSSGDSGIDVVGSSNGVRGEESDDFVGAEASITHTLQDLGDGI